MSVWYDIRKKKYSSGPGESWMRSYVDKNLSEFEDEMTAGLNRHTSGEQGRHSAKHIDCTNGETVQAALGTETAARIAGDKAINNSISALGTEINDLQKQIDDRYTKGEADAAVREYVALYDGHVQEMIGDSAVSLRGEIDFVASNMQSLNEDVYRKNETYSKEEVDELINPLKVYKTFGVAIDLSNSNPETAVTYTDDAVGMTAGSADWDSTDIFKDIKPCLFKDGAVVGYLKPNNFAQFEDGTSADITSGNAGDVMIEIPKMGYKIETADNTLSVKITNNPNNEDFCYLAHTRQTEGDRENLYVGAFMGYLESNKLRSLSGKMPTRYKSISEFRTSANANGNGFDILSFYPLTLIQCLYLIKYKNLNSQTAIGKGYVDFSNYSESSAGMTTGATKTNGMDYGTDSATQQMKFLGIEDLWGNLFCYIDGVKTDNSRNLLTATGGFASNDSYTNRGYARDVSIYTEYLKAPIGTNDAGFVCRTSGGSGTTYFADTATVEFSSNAFIGFSHYMDSNGATGAGIFGLHMYMNGPSTYYHGSRIMYL